jgi:hypothetical protein
VRLPADVPARIEPYVSRHAGQKHVLGRSLPEHGHPFVLEIADGPDVRPPEHLEAADVDAAEQHDGIPGVDPGQVDARELHHHVRAAGGDEPGAEAVGRFDVLHLADPVGPEQLLGQVLRCDADRGIVDEPEACCLEWRLGGDGPGTQAQESRRPRECHPLQEPPPTERPSLLDTHGNLPFRCWSVRHRARRPVDSSSLAQTGAAPNGPVQRRVGA